MLSKAPGLYIHIPFCVRKCLYCDFYSSTSISAVPDFLNALFIEMQMYCDRFGAFDPSAVPRSWSELGRTPLFQSKSLCTLRVNPEPSAPKPRSRGVDTLYIGGGTPSLLSPKQLNDVLTGVQKNFGLMGDPEITIETNPADLNRSLLKSMREMGINRINIGAQSFDEKVLKFLGRRHSAKQAVSAIEASRKAGFQNIGFDLIYGVPGQSTGSWLDTLKQAIAFSPVHLSCYQLTLEARTHLGIRYRAGEFLMPGEELEYEFFVKTSEFLEDAGYIHYEVSNFARGMKYASRHNQKYWDHSPYIGLGPSAHSFQDNRRWWNHRSLNQYITAINTGNLPIEGTEILTMEQLRLEALYLGLRTKNGVNFEEYKNRYCYDLFAEKKETIDKLLEEGFISIQDGRLCPTQTGLAVADHLALI